jgi:protein tyrosine/serine phosphatase
MVRTDRALLRAIRLSRWTLLVGALCGCVVGNRGKGVTFETKNPSGVSEVVPGKLYRSGQLTAHGLELAIADYGLRTVVNLRGEDPDPELGGGEREREFCAARGVRYVHLDVDPYQPGLYPSRDHPERPQPEFIQEFLATMSDSANWPVLIHCAGGKHRTGLLVGSYRISAQGYGAAQASAEMMSFGFEPADFRRNPHILAYLEYLAGSSRTAPTRPQTARTTAPTQQE